MTLVRETSPAVATSAGGTFWAFVPVVLLAASLAGVGSMCSIAIRDPGFALEKNYYERAVGWDGEQAQWRENARLGYHLDAAFVAAAGGTELVAHLFDRAGVPLRGAVVRVEAFANARSGQRRELTLTEGPESGYTGRLERARPGLWELRFRVEHDGARFTETVRADVPEGARP
ncbi:MAG TPA: FixH family protein [Polyangiaceae bacterium]|jgi:hypothetical protein|nr:FixH family protein [Polyangiaceae bacterium]